MNEDELRHGLRGAVPEPPAAPHRAAGARERARRARRRTTVGAVVGAAVVVAALAMVPMALPDDSSDTPPAPTSDALSCPRPSTPPTGADEVPSGAIAVRLCPAESEIIKAPADLLTTGIEQLTNLINAQPEKDTGIPCTADAGIDYQLAFRFADGTTQTVRGELYGCHELKVGRSVRTSPEKPYRAFIRMLRTQRTQGTPPAGLVSRPDCGDRFRGTYSPVAEPDDMVVATLCLRHAAGTKPAHASIAVPDDDLQLLLSDRAAGRADGRPFGCTSIPIEWGLVGMTAWGDTVEARMWCGAWVGDGGTIWSPGPRAQRILNRLMGEATDPGADGALTTP